MKTQKTNMHESKERKFEKEVREKGWAVLIFNSCRYNLNEMFSFSSFIWKFSPHSLLKATTRGVL